MPPDDLVFFSRSALTVNVVTLPSVDDWREELATLGLAVAFPTAFDPRRGGPLDVALSFSADAPVEGAERLHRRGRMTVRVTMVVQPAPAFDGPELEDVYDPDSIALIQRATYTVTFGSDHEPDLVAALLATAFAAAGEGVVYHRALDSASLGTDVEAMWRHLKEENDKL